MQNTGLIDTISNFENTWLQERPDLDPTAVATDLRMQLAARSFNDHSISALSKFDLEWWEYDVLSALRRVGQPYECPVNSLSDILPITSGALTNRLNQLVERKLVTRRGDNKDRRRVLIKLSEDGLSLVNKAATARFDAANVAVDGLNRTERADLDRLLEKLLTVC